MDKKRNRGKNFSEREKLLLLDLAKLYNDVIENKITNAVTNKMKFECWEKICRTFNAQEDSGTRTSEQLKHLYDCLKRKGRKDISAEKVMIYKTGGGRGESSASLDVVSERVIGLIQKQVTPLSCEVDSDATYHTSDTNDHLQNTLPLEPTEFVTSDFLEESGTTPEIIIETIPSLVTPIQRRPKRSLNDVYETVEVLAESQTEKNKIKKNQMLTVNGIKEKIYEIDLKMKEEELEAKRRRYAAEEEESQLRREILKIELEVAQAKLRKEINQF